MIVDDADWASAISASKVQGARDALGEGVVRVMKALHVPSPTVAELLTRHGFPTSPRTVRRVRQNAARLGTGGVS